MIDWILYLFMAVTLTLLVVAVAILVACYQILTISSVSFAELDDEPFPPYEKTGYQKWILRFDKDGNPIGLDIEG